MKLSIITVNFNNKDGLQKTIDSVISQTFKDFEWIVIDGGSTDGSKELIEKYSDHISYWVSEPDNGIYNAMNKGIKVSKGEYLEFLNSGDYYYDNKVLEKVSKHLAKYDFIYGCAVVKFKNKEKRIHLQKEYSSFYDLIKRTINHQSTFINKKVFEKHGLYDENLRIVSDWKFFLETIGIHKCTSRYINQNIIIFDPNGISFTNVSLREEERKQVLNQILPSFVIEDYLSHFQFNELLNHKITKKIVGILYRATIYLENKKLIRKS